MPRLLEHGALAVAGRRSGQIIEGTAPGKPAPSGKSLWNRATLASMCRLLASSQGQTISPSRDKAMLIRCRAVIKASCAGGLWPHSRFGPMLRFARVPFSVRS